MRKMLKFIKLEEFSNFGKLLGFALVMMITVCRQLAPVCAAANSKVLKVNTDLTASVVRDTDKPGVVLYSDIGDPVDVQLQSLLQQEDKPQHLQPAQPSVRIISNVTHICTREEDYVEPLRVPSMQPVRVRTSTWCLEFPPRCSNYQTEMRVIVKTVNVTKTRTIRFCCDGYEGNISINDTVCKPVCRGGCGRGRCQSPDICSCEAGYTGRHCTQRCDHDHWGGECKEECRCENGAVCDNKTGLCHCSSGWTGQFCQLRCPAGTYGVMCQKSCECESIRPCHPQTGACEQMDEVAANATDVMIQTLNSTIVNITNNLDRIAKNIVNIAPTPTTQQVIEAHTIVVPDFREVTTVKALPEVIVIKQDEQQHTPKIIVHQPGAGLLEDLHTAAAKAPEVIHVITSWQGHANNNTNSNTNGERNLNLAGLGGIPTDGSSIQSTTATEHDANLLTTILIILLVIMIGIGMSFLYVYRRYHWQKERVEAAIAARTASAVAAAGAESAGPLPGGADVGLCETAGPMGKGFLKPLPDLPAFTEMVRNKIEGPEFYDTPSNNSSIKTSAYDYVRKESLYSVVSPKSRKSSPDSHMYDEIRYPTAHQHHHQHPHHHHQHHHHQQQQQQLQLQHQQPQRLQEHSQHNAYVPALQQQSSVAHHVSHLLIPTQNSNFLQVPSTTTHSSHKIAHI